MFQSRIYPPRKILFLCFVVVQCGDQLDNFSCTCVRSYCSGYSDDCRCYSYECASNCSMFMNDYLPKSVELCIALVIPCILISFAYVCVMFWYVFRPKLEDSITVQHHREATLTDAAVIESSHHYVNYHSTSGIQIQVTESFNPPIH